MIKLGRETRLFHVGEARRKVILCDDAMDDQAVAFLYDHCRVLPYTFTDADRTDTRYVKHLVHNVAPPLHDSPLYHELIEISRERFRAASITPGELERIYINFNLFGDFQFAHDDGDVWTALIFVNQTWSPDWGGELLFYDVDRPDLPAWAIPLKPGRMILFDGRILHRGGIPSKFCLEPRITMVIKFCKRAAGARRRSPHRAAAPRVGPKKS